MIQLPKYAFFNGNIIPYSEVKLGVLNHSLNYGTGCFGGIRCYWNDQKSKFFLFRPADHFQRFLESATILRMTFPYSKEDLVNFCIELIKKEGVKTNAYLRPLAFFTDEIIGVRLHNLTPALSIVAIPIGNYLKNEDGLHVTVSSWRRIDDNIIPARGKITGGYVNSATAKTDAILSGFDEALLLNHDGHVAEGSAENLFIIRNGVAITPSSSDNILEGITRRSVITLLKNELGIDVVERSIDRTELFVADEVFLCGSAVQVAPVTKIDHRLIGKGDKAGLMGPITKKLRSLYSNVVSGNVEKYSSWCTEVRN